MGQLQSELAYRREAAGNRDQCHLPRDMVPLVHARKAQALASDYDYRTRCHEFTALPEDLKMAWAKKAHALQSEVGIIFWSWYIPSSLPSPLDPLPQPHSFHNNPEHLPAQAICISGGCSSQ